MWHALANHIDGARILTKTKTKKNKTEVAADPSAPQDVLRIVGARTHNLRDISLDIPHNQLTVITGVSGSGKSSLAFDTLYAEGQRQYMESLSTYARQFLDQLERPDVDAIEGLQPTLCIDQRSGTANPRSTVATVTEIYDYLRLLMARVGTPHCFACGKPILRQSPEAIVAALLDLPLGTKLVLMAPVVRGRKGAHREALAQIQKAGLVKVRVDNQLLDIDSVPELAVRQNHSIEAVVDKIVIRPESAQRLSESLDVALQLADGLAAISYLTPAAAAAEQANHWEEQLFSTRFACPDCNVSYEELEPRTFSFNSPYGACPQCEGIGEQLLFDPELIVQDWSRSPKAGALALLTTAPPNRKTKLRKELQKRLAEVGHDWTQPLDELGSAQRQRLFFGSATRPGLTGYLGDVLADADVQEQEWLSRFRQAMPCESCQGARLRQEALAVKLSNLSIFDLCSLSITQALDWFETWKVRPEQQQIAQPILNGMLHRLRFLVKVGVGYLALARGADTLSGGELQRVRLASSIGSGLVGVCYILDEPSIGLHQRDNDRLIDSLRELQLQGNTVIVVEHDEAMMMAADMLVDMGPGAGNLGGQIVVAGSAEQVTQDPHSLTAAYLRGERRGYTTKPRRCSSGPCIRLSGARLHNLKNLTVELPLARLVGVTGVSGSGKSSLIGETLIPALARELGQSAGRIGPYDTLSGVESVDKLIEITQSPIGRSSRSTPATYCGVFDLIRGVWANTRESKTRGYTSSRFSFNAGGGRCAECRGQGQEKIEMNFLADLHVTCSACGGSRFNRQTLQVKYRDKSIADALSMSVDEACDFFGNFHRIHQMLSSLQLVGLGYLQLGQSSSTLSGGEAQRIKLATELARPETGRTIYFLDEPTTGLHFDDVRRLVDVLEGLVERGNTVIVIEHNLDVIRACDWLIDIGPEGGDAGGEIIATGTPEEVAKSPESLTGRYLFPAED